MLRKLPKTYFAIEQISNKTRIAPGMHVMFRVKYKTDIYRDVRDTISFGTYTGADVNVHLVSSREAPLLRIYMFNFANKLDKECPSTVWSEYLDSARACALNYTFDCGNCLLGNHNQVSLIIKNEGSAGRFFFITEQDWYSDIVNVSIQQISAL